MYDFRIYSLVFFQLIIFKNDKENFNYHKSQELTDQKILFLQG